MRPISPADDELFALASAAAKLGRADKVIAQLADAHGAHPADPDHTEAACRYALAMMAALPSAGAEFETHARFTDTIKAFSQLLTLAPDHWLARYSRARLWALFPSSYGAYSSALANVLASAREDLDRLIADQSGQAPQPYFASTHALAAVVDQLADDSDPDRRAAHLAALAGCPRVPVTLPALGAVLCEPLVTLYLGAADPDRHTIGEVMAALYGDQAAVSEALRGQPVR